MKGCVSAYTGVMEVVAAATQAPSDVDAEFEELYRRSRDDVYAYVAGLLRDRSAARPPLAATRRCPHAHRAGEHQGAAGGRREPARRCPRPLRARAAAHPPRAG